MAYKDPDKQKQANREAAQRRRDRAKGMTQTHEQGMTQQEITPTHIEGMTKANPMPIIPYRNVIPKQDTTKIEALTKILTDTLGMPAVVAIKPKASNPAVQAIWDRRNAQGQAGGYSEQAVAEDYPQTQRPHRKPEPALAGETQMETRQ